MINFYSQFQFKGIWKLRLENVPGAFASQRETNCCRLIDEYVQLGKLNIIELTRIDLIVNSRVVERLGEKVTSD